MGRVTSESTSMTMPARIQSSLVFVRPCMMVPTAMTDVLP